MFERLSVLSITQPLVTACAELHDLPVTLVHLNDFVALRLTHHPHVHSHLEPVTVGTRNGTMLPNVVTLMP